MKVSKADFEWASSEGLLSPDQADALWAAFERRTQDRPAFDLVHIVYYFGAFIVLSAMHWFVIVAWERFGGGGIFYPALFYAWCFVFVGRRFWSKPGLRIPGGLLFTLAVCMTPLAIFGLEKLLGLWVHADLRATEWYHLRPKDGRLLMEAGTIIAGVIALKRTRFPFLTAPIAISLWAMWLDLALLLSGKPRLPDHEVQWIAVCFGLTVLVVSYLIDRRTKEDYAFWGYLYGTAAFWIGLTSMDSDSELGKFIYCLINIGLVLLSVLMARRVFIFFGALGVIIYLGHLAHMVFKDSLLFPVALTVLGLAIIYFGILYQRNRDTIERSIVNLVPDALRRLLPQTRVGGWE